MPNVSVELPADLAAWFSPDLVSEEAARLLALELFRDEKVSLGRAAELCGMPLAAFMDFAGRHGVSPLRNTFDDLSGGNDLEEERISVERLGV
jgi:predicted HTH domain antitoxin